MSDAASKLLDQLGFDDDEKKRVVTLVEDIYSSLAFRKIKHLYPLKKGEREEKHVEFLKNDIDEERFFKIYSFNKFVNESNDEYFSVPIDDKILRNDKVYKRLLNSDAPLSIEDEIEILQEKTNKSYFATLDIYNEIMSKIKKTCEKVLEIVGDNIANDPEKLAIVMHFVIDTVHVAEYDSIEIMKKKKRDEIEQMDPCDINKKFGVDWSFLGIFPKLPKDCADKKNSTKISIVGPITLVSEKAPNVQTGGKTRRRGFKVKGQRQTKLRQ